MKKITIFLISISAISIVLTNAHSEIKSTEIKSNGLKEFKQIYIGELNLNKAQWKELQFKSEEEWSSNIKEIEENFKTFMNKYAKGKTLSFAIDSKNIPKGPELDISFSGSKVDRGYKFGLGPWGAIETIITIKDFKSKKVVYKAVLFGRKSGGFGFNGQMKGAVKVLAKDISKVLEK